MSLAAGFAEAPGFESVYVEPTKAGHARAAELVEFRFGSVKWTGKRQRGKQT